MNRCLICDDHALVREALAGTVSMGWPGVTVDLAADFTQARAKADGSHDLIICDLIMPSAAPLAGIDGLLRAAPQSPLLVVTGTEDDALMLDLLDRGVAGFAPKSANGAIIDAAIRLILAGGRYLPNRLADIAASRLSSGSVIPKRDDVARVHERLHERLTDRQIAVLRLMAKGHSNKEIARTLGIAETTVKIHVQHILRKLDVSSRVHAAVIAAEQGIG